MGSVSFGRYFGTSSAIFNVVFLFPRFFVLSVLSGDGRQVKPALYVWYRHPYPLPALQEPLWVSLCWLFCRCLVLSSVVNAVVWCMYCSSWILFVLVLGGDARQIKPAPYVWHRHLHLLPAVQEPRWILVGCFCWSVGVYRCR